MSKSQISSPYIIATSCVFLACKVCYAPISLKTAATAYFVIDKSRNPLVRTSALTLDKEIHYSDLFEQAEFQILESIAFDFECELP